MLYFHLRLRTWCGSDCISSLVHFVYTYISEKKIKIEKRRIIGQCGLSKAIPQLQFFFVHASVGPYVTIVYYYLFLIFTSFDASGSLCFVIVTFPVYLNLYLLKVYADCFPLCMTMGLFSHLTIAPFKTVPESWRLYRCRWSGPPWLCLWFSWVLASDRQ